MKPEQSDHQPPSNRKNSDRSLVLLLAGCALLTPPLAGIFQLDIRIWGIPFTALYLFAVWAVLIAGTAALSGRLQNNAEWAEPESMPKPEEAGNTE